MRVVTLYRWLLTLPVIVPLTLFPLAYCLPSHRLLREFTGRASLAVLVGGIPYALLATGIAVWMRHRTERAIRTAMYLCPVLMVPLLAAIIMIVSVLEGQSLFDSDLMLAWVVYSGYALGFGYFYVGVAVAIAWLAKRTGAVAQGRG